MAKLQEVKRLLSERAMPEDNGPLFDSLGRLRITWTEVALESTSERLFPASRHRSARVHKKLVKRHGAEFVQRPCLWSTPWGWFGHPALRAGIEAALERKGWL